MLQTSGIWGVLAWGPSGAEEDVDEREGEDRGTARRCIVGAASVECGMG